MNNRNIIDEDAYYGDLVEIEDDEGCQGVARETNLTRVLRVMQTLSDGDDGLENHLINLARQRVRLDPGNLALYNLEGKIFNAIFKEYGQIYGNGLRQVVELVLEGLNKFILNALVLGSTSSNSGPGRDHYAVVPNVQQQEEAENAEKFVVNVTYKGKTKLDEKTVPKSSKSFMKFKKSLINLMGVDEPFEKVGIRGVTPNLDKPKKYDFIAIEKHQELQMFLKLKGRNTQFGKEVKIKLMIEDTPIKSLELKTDVETVRQKSPIRKEFRGNDKYSTTNYQKFDISGVEGSEVDDSESQQGVDSIDDTASESTTETTFDSFGSFLPLT